MNLKLRINSIDIKSVILCRRTKFFSYFFLLHISTLCVHECTRMLYRNVKIEKEIKKMWKERQREKQLSLGTLNEKCTNAVDSTCN